MKILITTKSHPASYQLAFLLKNENLCFGEDFKDFPDCKSNSFAHQLLAFCLDEQIEMVFPLYIQELEPLSKSVVLFEEYGIELMLNVPQEHKTSAFDKEVSSYAELSTGLIALGYPQNSIAIADANGGGAFISLDDEVKNGFQIWSHIKSLNFTQLGKWFNQNDFNKLHLYKITHSLSQFYVLVAHQQVYYSFNLSDALKKQIEKILVAENYKGLLHVAADGDQILRINNAVIYA